MKRLIWLSGRKRGGRGTLAGPRRAAIVHRRPAGAPEEPESLEHVERVHVQRILSESASLTVAAARLGIDLTTLWRKRKRWGLA